MINRATLNKTLSLKVRVYQYTILYAKNCTISIRDEELNEEMVINKGNIVFFQRNINIRITMMKNGECEPYEIYTLTNDTLAKLVKILEPVMLFPMEINSNNRSLYHKVFSIDGTDYHKFLFETVKKLKNDNATIYTLACLFIQVRQANEIYSSLCISASRYFSDSVRKIIESDLSKKWKLSNISEALNLSEVAVRKKLDSENTNFNQMLLDVRMQKARSLILDDNNHISRISASLGMSSTSYFIRIFSNYYGVTPKQFYLYYKGCRSMVVRNKNM
ncbi:helix-turn-helix transcriptional regulator [Escherichia marmotae]|uniref:helix-turn-helix transcriptional regulator n=1 Tax=Escherichia marmotae TaxID=1499973 RepID=UPI0020015251|nr:response regulator transcription factor [Escherichia marmotae]